MKQVKLMLVIASFFCIFSCTREPILVEMENSSEEDIVVEFDDRPPFTLPKKSYYAIKLPPGNRKVKFNNGEGITFHLNYNRKTFLNPGKGKYYFENAVFVGKGKPIFDQYVDTFFVGGYKIVGPFEFYSNEIIINGDWDFGLRELIPNQMEIKTDKYSLGYVTARKYKLVGEQYLINQAVYENRKMIYSLRENKVKDKEIKLLLELSDEQFKYLSGDD